MSCEGKGVEGREGERCEGKDGVLGGGEGEGNRGKGAGVAGEDVLEAVEGEIRHSEGADGEGGEARAEHGGGPFEGHVSEGEDAEGGEPGLLSGEPRPSIVEETTAGF